MASREFLKILRSARLGDVSAQQQLASAYLNGSFNTPIQPANALIWLEKSYLFITNQKLNEYSSGDTQISQIQQQISEVPLFATFNSPAFTFGWECFWSIAEEKTSLVNTAAKWQLADLLLNPLKKELQNQLEIWVSKKGLGTLPSHLKTTDFTSLKNIVKEYAQSQ